MLKLGFRISHMQVARILRSQGIPPAPRRGQTSWREFVRRHAAQMLACDFFTVLRRDVALAAVGAPIHA